ncbi:hypothetical protein SASC598P14_000400, partial [Snodgrassella alvi SCGC AB-598-P14]
RQFIEQIIYLRKENKNISTTLIFLFSFLK